MPLFAWKTYKLFSRQTLTFMFSNSVFSENSDHPQQWLYLKASSFSKWHHSLGLRNCFNSKCFPGSYYSWNLRPSRSKSLDRHDIIYIPQTAISNTLVTPLLPKEQMYNFGRACNWKLFWLKPLFMTPVPWFFFSVWYHIYFSHSYNVIIVHTLG